MSDADIGARKGDHIRLCLEDEVEVPLHPRAGAYDAIRLVYQALPEIDLDEVDTSVTFLGKRLSMPLFIGSMTGGTEEAGRLNRRLAEAAQRTGVGMFLGSQRIMIERPEVAATFQVRAQAPDILLVGNIGAVQLNYGVTAADIRRVAEAVGADAMVFHLNAAQEAVQAEGDTRFRGILARMAETIPEVGLPCGAKEVGSGLSIDAAAALGRLPLAFIESAGRGGTSWTAIEGKRAADAGGRALGDLFADWGVPAVTSLLACVGHGGGKPVIASGGVRTGLDVARALAAGASAAAMALPLLKAAARSADAVVEVIEGARRALKVAMFLSGARDVAALRRARVRIDPAVLPAAYEGRPAPA